MSDPYADQFARDYISSADFGRMYGINNEVILRISQFGTIDRRDPGAKNGEKKPRAVVWFVEHRNLPFFVNQTMHEIMLDRFGNLYWDYDNRDAILYAPIRMRAYKDTIFGKLQTIVEVDPSFAPDHRVMIGGNSADKFRKYCADKGVEFKIDKFRWFVHQEHPDALHILDSCEGIEQLPVFFRAILNDFVNELVADLSSSQAKQSGQAIEPKGNPNFEPTRPHDKVEFTHSDIPF